MAAVLGCGVGSRDEVAQVDGGGGSDVVISAHDETIAQMNHIPPKRPVQAFR